MNIKQSISEWTFISAYKLEKEFEIFSFSLIFILLFFLFLKELKLKSLFLIFLWIHLCQFLLCIFLMLSLSVFFIKWFWHHFEFFLNKKTVTFIWFLLLRGRNCFIILKSVPNFSISCKKSYCSYYDQLLIC